MNDKIIAQKGDQITLNYEGKLDSGEIFDSSFHGDHNHPLTFTSGNGEVVDGFDEAVLGMSEGEEKTFKIPSGKAYGEYDDKLMQDIPRENLPKDQEPKAGMMLVMQDPAGNQMPVKIAKVDEKSVTLDLNHPLAGKDLTFRIKIEKIIKKP